METGTKINKGGRINDIREMLNSFWNDAGIRARSWGLERGKDMFFGSHILIGDEDNIVVIIEHRRTREVSVVEYVLAKEPTPLGDKIRTTIEEQGVNFSKTL